MHSAGKNTATFADKDNLIAFVCHAAPEAHGELASKTIEELMQLCNMALGI